MSVDAEAASDIAPVQSRHDTVEVGRLFTSNRRQLRAFCYMLLLVADLLCIFGAFALGSLLRHGDVEHLAWLRISFAVTPLFIISAMHSGAYSLAALKSASAGARRAATALVSSFAILFVMSYFLKAEQDVSRLTVGVGLIVAVAAVAIARTCVGRWIRQISQDGLTATVILADEKFVEAPDDAVLVDALKMGIRPEPRNPVMVQRLAMLLHGADRVIVACRREVCPKWAAMLKGANVCGEIISEDVQSLGAVAVARYGDRSTLIVSAGPLSTQQSILKRAFDLCLAVPLVLFIAPVLVAIAIAIRIDSRGPILFCQTRVGFGNRPFTMYKFRSMAAESTDPTAKQLTLQDDARVTRVGRFIRMTSLDELPQLFNVIAGSMSLVGPRPHALGACAGPSLYWDVDDRYGHRHLLKPGITGLAQVRGYRGTTHRVDDLTLRLQSDLEYMIGWSLWRDIVILLKTFGVVVHPNAY